MEYSRAWLFDFALVYTENQSRAIMDATDPLGVLHILRSSSGDNHADGTNIVNDDEGEGVLGAYVLDAAGFCIAAREQQRVPNTADGDAGKESHSSASSAAHNNGNVRAYLKKLNEIDARVR